MKKILPIISLILFCTALLFGQKTFENKKFGFSMQEPKDWIVATNKEINENLEKFEFTEENLSRLLATGNGSILLTAFYKYDAKKHTGLIPTIQITVRPKSVREFPLFKNAIVKSAINMKNFFADYEFIEEPEEIEISGIKSVIFTAKFIIKTQKGEELKVRSRTLAIPYKNYFFQVNFTDGQVREDSSKLFNELLKTIKIGN